MILFSRKKVVYLLFVTFFFYSSFLFALPKYSLSEKKRCYECHYNKKGGGPLNEKGKYYSRYRSLKGPEEEKVKVAKVVTPPPAPPKIMVSKKEKEKEKEKAKIVPVEKHEETTAKVIAQKEEAYLFENTRLSANILFSYLSSDQNSGPNNFFLMKAEPLITTEVTNNFHTVFGYNFAAPLLTAYGQFNLENYYVQLGSFHLPFGLDSLDHNNVVSTLIKENYDVTLDTRDIGVEAGYEKDFFLRGAILNGAREPRQRPTLLASFDRNPGFVVNGGYEGIALKVPFLLGSSYLYERRIPPGKVLRGRPPMSTETISNTWILNLYGQLAYEAFALLGEFAYGRNTPFVGDRSFGFYLRPSYNILKNWSIATRGELFARDRHFLQDSWLRLVLSSEYYFSKYASIEPMFRLNYESGNVPNVRDNEFILLVSMNF